MHVSLGVDVWQGGCKKCRRVWLLLQYHAKSCKNKDCPVPKCPQIREALRYATPTNMPHLRD